MDVGMTFGAEAVGAVTQGYLLRYPGERPRLARLLEALADGGDLGRRDRWAGHLTCGAVLLDGGGRVLHIRHRTLGRWLLPGGHVEAGDGSLVEATLREVYEETGLPARFLVPFPGAGPVPFDVDVHAIPANPGRGEPEHWHFDFRYAFRVAGEPTVRLQLSEVSAYGWLAGDAVESAAVRRKLPGGSG